MSICWRSLREIYSGNIFLFMKKCENVTFLGETSLFRATYLEK